jgi:hypothetical protein
MTVTGARLGDVNAGDNSLGVLMLTGGGIVFLPDADASRVTGWKQAATVAWEFAKDKLPLVDVLLKSGLDPKLDTPKSTPIWMVESHNHPNHFAIPWIQIVEATYSPETVQTTITRERDDGQRERVVIGCADDSLPAFVFNQRMSAEALRVVYKRLLLPKQMELIPELTEKFAAIYGDRVAEHGSEIVDEAGRQASAWAKSQGLTVFGFAAGEMLDLAEHYRRIPGIEERNEEFFAAVDAKRAATPPADAPPPTASIAADAPPPTAGSGGPGAAAPS